MISDRIKETREQNGMTQSDLAKKIGITRSSVNAWEMGISVPSTQYLVELAQLFHVSTDYLLGLDSTKKLDISFLSEDEQRVVSQLLALFTPNTILNEAFKESGLEAKIKGAAPERGRKE